MIEYVCVVCVTERFTFFLQVTLGLGLDLLAGAIVTAQRVSRLFGQVLDKVVDFTTALVFSWAVLVGFRSKEDGWESEIE